MSDFSNEHQSSVPTKTSAFLKGGGGCLLAFIAIGLLVWLFNELFGWRLNWNANLSGLVIIFLIGGCFGLFVRWIYKKGFDARYNRFPQKGIEKKRGESFLDRTLYSRSVQGYIGWLPVFLLFGSFLVLPVSLIIGERDSIVEIIDSNIKISGRYGLTIDFSEITDISLMEDRIGVIGITRRTFAYGTSTTQKGRFESSRYGSVLLYTRANSSPTIHIKREGKEDVFLNFGNNEATRTLYNEMTTAFAMR